MCYGTLLAFRRYYGHSLSFLNYPLDKSSWFRPSFRYAAVPPPNFPYISLLQPITFVLSLSLWPTFVQALHVSGLHFLAHQSGEYTFLAEAEATNPECGLVWGFVSVERELFLSTVTFYTGYFWVSFSVT